MTMTIQPDLPNGDHAGCRSRKLRVMKFAARSLELKIARMEREKQRCGRREPRTTHFEAQKRMEGRGRDDQFSLGRAARPAEMREKSSRDEMLMNIAWLHEGDGAWVKRSGNGDRWTYAVVKERCDSPNLSLTFTVDERGSTKKFPLAYWHKFVRTLEKGPAEAISKKEDHASRTKDQKVMQDESSSSSLSHVMEVKEDVRNEASGGYRSVRFSAGDQVVIHENEVSMYTLGHEHGPHSSALVVLQDNDISTFALEDGDQQPETSPLVRQARCGSRTACIFSRRRVGSRVDDIDAPTKPEGAGEVERTLRLSSSLSQNGLQKLRQSNPTNFQAFRTGETVKTKEDTEANTKMHYPHLPLPRNPWQEEGPDEFLTRGPIHEPVGEEARAETKIHHAEKEPGDNSLDSVKVLLTSGWANFFHPILSPILEQGGRKRTAKRQPKRPANRREELNGGEGNRGSELVKQELFHLALKSIHRGSSPQRSPDNPTDLIIA